MEVGLVNTNFTGEVGHPDRPTGPCMCLISAVARVSQITAGGQSFCILCFCSCDLALLRNRRPTHRDRFAHWRCAENNNQNEFATILRRAAETRASERRAAAERAKAAEAARNAAKAEAARARKAARKVAEAEAARAAKAAMDAKRAATAIAEMTTAAAATDGLGVRDSVADLRAAHERITRAATARARPARGGRRAGDGASVLCRRASTRCWCRRSIAMRLRTRCRRFRRLPRRPQRRRHHPRRRCPRR